MCFRRSIAGLVLGIGWVCGFVRDVGADVRGGYPAPSFLLKPGTALPSGLRLTTTGILVGTPTASGTFRFTVIARNVVGVAEKQIVLRIRDPFSATAVYQSGDLDPAIRDAQVFLNSTDCPVAQTGVGSSRKEVLSFLPSVEQAVSCYQRRHALPVTGTLMPSVFQHFVLAYNARFVPGDFTLPPGTLSSLKPRWRDAVASYTVSVGESVSRDVAGLLADGYPLPDFRVQSGSLPTGLALRGDGMVSGTPYSAGSATTFVVATNDSGSAVLQVVWRVEEGVSVYALGDRHPDIRQAQIYLNGTACPVARAGVGSPGRETSYFGPATLRAVRCYQSLHKMSVTGTITSTLLKRLAYTYDPGSVPEPIRESCAAGIVSHCVLSSVAHDITAGSCAAGYSGSCQYRCNDGVWNQVSYSCSQPAAPISQDGVCDTSYSQGCVVGTPVQYDPSYIAHGERWRCRGVNYGYSSEWCVRCDGAYAFDGQRCSRQVGASSGERCSSTTLSYCRLGRGIHGATTSGVCSAGRTGECQYACNNGVWSLVGNSCIRLSRCATGTFSGCAVGDASHGDSAGSCAAGYTTGSCRYRCNDGTWGEVSNTCARSSPASTSTPTESQRTSNQSVNTNRPINTSLIRRVGQTIRSGLSSFFGGGSGSDSSSSSGSGKSERCRRGWVYQVDSAGIQCQQGVRTYARFVCISEGGEVVYSGDTKTVNLCSDSSIYDADQNKGMLDDVGYQKAYDAFVSCCGGALGSSNRRSPNTSTKNTNTNTNTTNTHSSSPQWCWEGRCYDCDCSSSTQSNFSACRDYCGGGTNTNSTTTTDPPSSPGSGGSPPSSPPPSPPFSPSSPSCSDQNKLDLPCLSPFCGSADRCVVCSSDGSCASYSYGGSCGSDDDC